MMNNFCTKVIHATARVNVAMRTLNEGLVALINQGLCGACWNNINLSVTDLTPHPIQAPLPLIRGLFRLASLLFQEGVNLMNIDVVSPRFDPSSAEVGDVNYIVRAIADLVGEVSSWNPSASHSAMVTSTTRSIDGKP